MKWPTCWPDMDSRRGGECGGGLLAGGVMRRLSDRVVDGEIAELSAGERLRRALIELGTTWIKFGQMLNLRPDVVGADVADELTKPQASVPADPPGARAGPGRT